MLIELLDTVHKCFILFGSCEVHRLACMIGLLERSYVRRDVSRLQTQIS
jgi:hypothetical protein